jgi:hypothetical protein
MSHGTFASDLHHVGDAFQASDGQTPEAERQVTQTGLARENGVAASLKWDSKKPTRFLLVQRRSTSKFRLERTLGPRKLRGTTEKF